MNRFDPNSKNERDCDKRYKKLKEEREKHELKCKKFSYII